MAQGIHLISNGKQTLQEFIEVARSASPYVNYIHLREKTRSIEELVKWTDELVRKGISKNQIVINEHVELAVESGVKGVQLTSHSEDVASVRKKYPHLLIGRSVHSLEEAKHATVNGADYLIYGHIFNSNSKLGLSPRGLKQLKYLSNSINIPIIAVGGITPQRVKKVICSGASGVAVMSGLIDSKQPDQEAKLYLGGIRDGYSHKW